MKYDFDKIVNRSNTNSIKYDYITKNRYSKDTIPLWVADLEVRAAVFSESTLPPQKARLLRQWNE